MPKKSRPNIDEIVRREEPGYAISKPTAQDPRQQAAPDAVVPSIANIQSDVKRGPGADAIRSTTRVSTERDTEVRLLSTKDKNTDATGRAMGPKAVVVSRSQGKIVSR